jgi:tetratricopeptide (TPR) repeat protein
MTAFEVAWEPGPAGLSLPPALAQLRGAFVGRSAESASLRRIWDACLAGEARRLVFVAGEPGIGKTRLVAERAREVSTGDGVVLFGRCDEGLGAPYQPWAQALAGLGAERLRAVAGGDAKSLAHLVPVLGPPSAGADPEAERWRLFEAVDQCLASLAAAAPVLVVLDDLHWADASSLLLLRHVARSSRAGPLVVVGTYRDTELDRVHALSDALADLRRDQRAERVVLRGLDERATGALIASLTGDEPVAEMARAVHVQTEGNPFFVGEVVRHLAEAGPGVGVPEGVREVIGRRLSRLSTEANEALAVAAVIGRDFDADVVEAAGGPAGDVLAAALDEAVGARVLDEEEGAFGRYRFAHALIRQTVEAELTTNRRVRLQWRIGEILQRMHPDDLGAIAHHLVEGALAGHNAGAVDACLAAGRAAFDQLAWEEAAQHYQSALALLDQAELAEPHRRHALLMGLGNAQARLRNQARQNAAWLDAAEIACRLGDGPRMAEAVYEYARVGMLAAEPAVSLWHEALELLGPEDSYWRCVLLSEGAYQPLAGYVDGDAAVAEAEVLARRLDDPVLLARTRYSRYILELVSADAEQQLALAAEVLRLATAAGDEALVQNALRARSTARLKLADRAGAEAVLAELQAMGKRLLPVFEFFVTNCTVAIALAEGRFDDAKGLAVTTLRQNPDAGIALMGLTAQLFLARLEQGQAGRAASDLAAVIEREETLRLPWGPALASAYLQAGDHGKALAQYERLGVEEIATVRAHGAYPIALRHFADAIASVGDAQRAHALLPLCDHYAGQLLVGSLGLSIEGAGDRVIAQLLATIGRFDEAVSRYERALALEEGFGAQALAGRTRYWLARCLLDRDQSEDRGRAHRLLDECIASTAELGMAVLGRQALELQVS